MSSPFDLKSEFNFERREGDTAPKPPQTEQDRLIESLLAEPDFKSLTRDEQRSMLAETSPEFAKLTDVAQRAFLAYRVPSAGQSALGRNLNAGFKAATADSQKLAANTLELLDKAELELDELVQPYPALRKYVTRSGAFGRGAEAFRTRSGQLEREAELQADAGALNSAARIAGGLPMQVLETAAFLSVAGPAVALGAQGALRRADEGVAGAVEGGVKGALLGKLFGSSRVAELGRLPRFGILGAGAAALGEGDLEQRAVQGVTAGLLGMIPGARPRPVSPGAAGKTVGTGGATAVEPAAPAPPAPGSPPPAPGQGGRVFSAPGEAERIVAQQRAAQAGVVETELGAARRGAAETGAVRPELEAVGVRAQQPPAGVEVPPPPSAPAGPPSPVVFPRDAQGRILPQPKPVEPPGTVAGVEVSRLEQRLGDVEGMPAPRMAGNIRTDKILGPEDVRTALEEIAAQRGGSEAFAGARRGVQTFEATQQLANRINIDELLKSRKPGQAYNAEQQLAARDLLAQTSRDVADAVATLKDVRLRGTPEAIDAARLRVTETLTRNVLVQQEVAGITAEAGRALSILRKAGDAAQYQKALAALQKKLGGADKIDDVAAALETFDNPNQMLEFAQGVVKTTNRDRLFELWINGLLSGGQTQIANVIGNSTFNLLNLAERAVAGVGRAALTGDTAALRELGPRLVGTIQGFREGLTAAGRAFMTERSGFGTGIIEGAPGRGTAIGGPSFGKLGAKVGVKNVGQAVRLPSRLLQSSDELFKSVAYRQEINALATRLARAEGLRGQALKQRIGELRARPTESMMATAREAAAKLTFTNELGATGRKAQALQQTPLGRIISPFFRTPINILKAGIARTPYAIVTPSFWQAMRAGGAARDKALAQVAMGTGFGLWATTEVLEGNITGAAPADEGERNVFYASGRQPYSFRSGDEWISYARIEPIASILGTFADGTMLAADAPELEREEFLQRLVLSFVQNFGSKSYLQGLSSVVAAMTDPERSGGKAIEKMLGSLIPTGVAQLARTQDPALREANGILETWMSRIPGQREKLAQRYSILGKPEEFGGSKGPDLLSPLYSRPAGNDPVAEELFRIKADVPSLRRDIDGERMSAEDYQAGVKWVGETVRPALERAMNSERWGQLPDDVKRMVVEEFFDRVRSAQREIMRGKKTLREQGR